MAAKLGMPLSDTTLLWSLHLVALPPVESVQIVGIDDWAWRRGHRYGTLLVDLKRHRVIDLLADRSVASAQQWLEAHPDLEVVSRDRGGTYAEAATAGVPLALQVADRWHLCKNLGDAVEAFLIRARIRLSEQAPAETAPFVPLVPSPARFVTPRSQQLAHARLQRKWELMQRVQELHRHGVSIHQMAIQLDLARQTVRKYLQQSTEPVPTPRHRKSRLDPFEAYLVARWTAGCRNAALLFREIQAQGYSGCNTMVRAYLATLRKQGPHTTEPQRPKPDTLSVSPRDLRWLLARRPEELDQDEQERLERLLQPSAEVQTVYQLLQAFLTMMRQRQHLQLRAWMEAASTSGIAELRSFVAGIERDYEAVEAALRLAWSQGQTEGQVNKLKTLKRMMYDIVGEWRDRGETIFLQAVTSWLASHCRRLSHDAASPSDWPGSRRNRSRGSSRLPQRQPLVFPCVICSARSMRISSLRPSFLLKGNQPLPRGAWHLSRSCSLPRAYRTGKRQKRCGCAWTGNMRST